MKSPVGCQSSTHGCTVSDGPPANGLALGKWNGLNQFRVPMVLELRTPRDHIRRPMRLAARVRPEVAESTDSLDWRGDALVVRGFSGGPRWPQCERPSSVAYAGVPRRRHGASTGYGCGYRQIDAHGA